mmetsp:Transcript_6022/g.10263  ORF Transcript_6022/g.10263 Transcript_6022/m.10263 type:complete len:323 (-) Transcript_6022:593-1561(-)
MKKLKRQSWALGLTVIHLSYAPVSFKIFQTFMCEEFDDKSEYLIADYSIDCNSDEYAAMQGFASLMILIYPLGVPALYTMLLASKRRLINPLPEATNEEALEERNRNSERISHLEFLYGLYWPRFYLTEVFECMRRLLLTGLPVLFMPGSATTCATGVMVCFMSITTLASYKPCMSPVNTRILMGTQIAQFFTLFSGLLLMLQVDGELGDGGEGGFAHLLLIVNVLVLLALFAGMCIEVTILYQEHGELAKQQVVKSKPIQRILSLPVIARVLSTRGEAKPRQSSFGSSFDSEDGISMANIHASKKSEYFVNPLQNEQFPNH